jgi:hypothetical protein
MNEEKGLSVVRTFDDAARAADAMAASGFFPDSRQAAQAIVKILAGQELGFGPFASMTGVNIIQGKPVLGANFMAAAVKRTGKYNYRIIHLDDMKCELAFFEGGLEVGRSVFTMEDAKKANLTGKDNWQKYPRNMLFARALSNGQKWYAPDVFNGATVYTPDELGAVTDEDGNVIAGQFKDVEVTSPIPVEHEVPVPVQPVPVMNIDTAMKVMTSEDEPRSYGSLTDKELEGCVIGLRKAIAKNSKTPEEMDDLKYKLSAAVTILNERAKAK